VQLASYSDQDRAAKAMAMQVGEAFRVEVLFCVSRLTNAAAVVFRNLSSATKQQTDTFL
jgi:hypothetical protein